MTDRDIVSLIPCGRYGTRMLEEYRQELEAELKEVNKELEEMKKGE